MNRQHSSTDKKTGAQNNQHKEKQRFSPATLKVATENLKKLEHESNEAFLIRADIDRKLSSL